MSEDSKTAKAFWDTVRRSRPLLQDDAFHNHSTFVSGQAQVAARDLDREVEAISGLLQFAKTRRNMLEPICRLPPEVLARIFSFIQDVEASTITTNQGRTWMLPQIISLSHVCGHWRQVALQHPSLWTDIDTPRLSPTYIKLLLARAKNAVLSVKMETPQYPTDESAYHLIGLVSSAEALARVRDLHITFYPDNVAKDINRALKMLDKPTPVLEHLTVDPGSRYLSESHDMALPESLFACTAPSLRTLRLRNCAIHSRSPLLSGIVDFELSLHWSAHELLEGFAPSGEQLATLFSGMPALRRVRLYNAYPYVRGRFWTKRKSYRVVLPAGLQTLELGGEFVDCVDFACSITAPPAARVSISLDGDVRQRSIMQALFAAFSRPSTPPVRMRVTAGASSFFLTSLDLWYSTPTNGAIPLTTDENPAFHWDIDLPNTYGQGDLERLPRPDSQYRLCQGLNLDALVELDVDGEHNAFVDWSVNYWLKAFTDAKNVQRLRVTCAALPVVHALVVAFLLNLDEIRDIPKRKAGASGVPEGLLFPALEHLRIVADFQDDEARVPDLADLVKGLEGRWKVGGHRLQTLELSSNLVDKQSVNRLKKLVQTVVVIDTP